MTENNKGCVYFFRHIGLKPVKIGYSTKNDPLMRFEQFKTYAPYGGEVLGYFNDEEPSRAERELHKELIDKRLTGEWFDLTTEDVENLLIRQKKIIAYWAKEESLKNKKS